MSDALGCIGTQTNQVIPAACPNRETSLGHLARVASNCSRNSTAQSFKALNDTVVLVAAKQFITTVAPKSDCDMLSNQPRK
jgi:hypothetical protein